MASTSNSAERWVDHVSDRVSVVQNDHLIARHLLFSLSVVLTYLVLSQPWVILVSSGLGLTAWYPATGLVFAVMLCIGPRYFPLLVLADVLAGIAIYHQPLLSWSGTIAPVLGAGSYAGAAYLLRGPLRIDLVLRHRRDVVRYVFVAMVAALPATLVGVASLAKDHTILWSQFWNSAAQWYIGDVIGLIGFAPFLLVHVFPRVARELSTFRREAKRRVDRPTTKLQSRRSRQILEAIAQAIAILLVLWIMFGRAFGTKEFYFLSFVPIIWIAIRQGMQRIVTALVVFNFGIVVALRIFPLPADYQIKVGVLMLAVSGTGLIVGSEVTERHRTARQLNDRTGFLNSLIERNPLAIAIQDSEGCVRFCNDAFGNLFLYSHEEVVGNPLDPLICPPGSVAEDCTLSVPSRPGESAHKAVRRVRKDGKILDVELHRVAINLDSQQSGAYAIFRDISEQVKSAAEAEEHAMSLNNLVTELQLRTMQMSLLNEMGDLLQCCGNMEEAFAVVAQSARKLFSASTGGTVFVFGPSKEALHAAATWGEDLASESVTSRADCWALRRGQPHWSEQPGGGVICPHLKDPVAASYLCVPMAAQGDTLGILHVQYNRSQSAKGTEAFESLQQSQQRLATAVAGQVGLALASLRLRESLREQSTRDPLTGLFNRRFMQESLDRELLRSKRKGCPLTLVLLDIDHFKHFNDTFGHEAGDAVLCLMAETLRLHYRGEDVICRYGGEEFAILLPEAAAGDAAKRSESLREAIKTRKVLHLENVLDAISVSIGIAAYPEHASDGVELLRVADASLYQSKEMGRDRITIAGRSKG
jgi:diguanylate cyclase (GGDEF)-like protein/PAS domain S-box-containing protein